MQWVVRVWSLPDDPDGFRVLCEPPVIEARVTDRDDANGTGIVKVPADYEHLRLIRHTDPADPGESHDSLICFHRVEAGQILEKPDVEFYSDDATESIVDGEPVVTISGQVIRSGVDDGTVRPRTETERSWIWGGENALPDLRLAALNNVNEEWHLWSDATSGTMTLTVDGQTTDSFAFNTSDPASIENRIQALSNVTDVTVAGEGTEASPWIIVFYDPPDPDTVTVDDSGLSGGTATLEKEQEGGLDASPITQSQHADQRVSVAEHGTYGSPPIIPITQSNLDAGASWALQVNATGQFAGSQIVVSVNPGQTYQSSIRVKPSVDGKYRLVIRDRHENLIKATSPFEVPLTAGSYQDLSIPDVLIPPGVTEVVMRVAVVSDAPAEIDTFWCNWEHARFDEGMVRTTIGHIDRLLVEAVQERGGLPWLQLGFTDTTDSTQEDWDTDALAWRADVGEHLAEHQLAAQRDAGYESEVVRLDSPFTPGNPTHELRLYNPGNKGAVADTQIVIGSFESGRLASRRLRFTHLLVEDDTGAVVEVTDGMLAGLSRREAYLRAEFAPDLATAAKVGVAALAEELADLLAAQVKLSGDTVVPYRDFSLGWSVPYSLGRVGRHDRRIHSITLKLPAKADEWEAEVTASRLYPSDDGDGGAAMWEAIRKLYAEFSRKRRPRPGGTPILGGGGGDPSIFVAASNASESSKALAHLLCSGVDDHLVIMQAEAMLPTSPSFGGRIVLSEGSFWVDPGEIFLSDRIHLHGLGENRTIIRNQSAGTDALVHMGTESLITNIGFLTASGFTGHCVNTQYGTVADVNHIGGPARAAFLIRGGQDTIRHIEASGTYTDAAIVIGGTSSDLVSITDAIQVGGSGTFMYIENQSARALITHCFASVFSGSGHGFRIRDADKLVISNCNLRVQGDAISIDNGSPTTIIVSDSMFDAANGIISVGENDGMERLQLDTVRLLVDGTGIDTFTRFAHFTNLIVRSRALSTSSPATGDGINIRVGLSKEPLLLADTTVYNFAGNGVVIRPRDPVTIKVEGLRCHDVYVDEIGEHGFVFEGVRGGTVHDCEARVVGETTANTFDAFHFHGDCERVRVHDNKPWPLAATRYGMNIADPECVELIVVGNDLGDPTAYGTDALNNDGTDTELTYPGHATYGDNFTS